MTQAEYARHRGVTRQAVHKLVAAGKLPVIERGGKLMINAADADFALGAPPRAAAPAAAPAVESNIGLTKARTATEVYRARMAKLEYERLLGRLRPTEEVTAAAQVCGARLVRALDQVVRRADEIAAAAKSEGSFGVRQALKRIVRDLRAQVAGEFASLAAGAPAPAVPAEEEEEERE